MVPLTLEEFGQQLRLEGSPFAAEILELVDLEAEVAEPYWQLVDDLKQYAPDDLKENASRTVEYLGDRSDLLGELEKMLKEAGRLPDGREIDDEIRHMIGALTPPEMEYDL